MIYIKDSEGREHFVSANGVDACDQEPRANEIKLAKSFFETCTPSKTTFINSYRLKHLAEDRARPAYISNGALITAAYEMGLGIKCFPRSPNAGIAVSKNIFKQKEPK